MVVTKPMVKHSFLCFKVADVLNILPFTLNLKSGKLSHEATTLTSIIHNASFGVICLKCCQLVYVLISMLIANEKSQMAVTILTGLWGSLCITSTFWSYELFHKGFSETILLFNSLNFRSAQNYKTFEETTNGHNWNQPQLLVTVARLRSKPKSLVKTLLRLSIQEMLLVACPYAVNIFAPIYLGMMALFPHWPVFATSLLEPGTWGYWLSIGLEFVAAFFMQWNILFLFFFELALQTFHFANVDHVVLYRGLVAKTFMRNSMDNLDECIRRFDYYFMIFKLCNVLFSRVLFTGKLMALSCSIFGTYYVMTHAHSASPILLVFFSALSVDAIGFYVISCKRLFEVPALMGRLKNLCVSLLDDEKGKILPLDAKVRKYKIQAMQLIGISDGGFRYMDSTSTLVFIDFYLNRVIALLLL